MIGGFGGVLLLVLLTRGWEELVPTIVLALGTAYAIALFGGRHPLDQAAPLVGLALLASSELAAWSRDERLAVPHDRGVVAARAAAVAVLLLAGLAASTLVVVVALAPVGNGLGWAVLGAAAAVLTVGVGALFASR